MLVQKWGKNHVCVKDYILNPSICNFENGKYLENIIDDSIIMSN